MAAPVGHLTVKFNSIKFNSLGLLVKEDQLSHWKIFLHVK